MSRPTSASEPIRNRNGEDIYSSLEDRPAPAFALDNGHKLLLIISAIIAVAVPLLWLSQALVMTERLPVRYSVTGEVLRLGSAWEVFGALVLLGLAVLTLVTLTRYPRIYNYPGALTAANVQRQYKTAVQMLSWIAFSMALIMVISTANWLGILSMTWIWLGAGLMVAAVMFFLWRMVKQR